jgi:hypothetical protein
MIMRTIKDVIFTRGYRMRVLAALALACFAPATLCAQKTVDITGTWRIDVGTDTKNGPREVIIRADSSASWGKDIVRWRLKGDKISILLGGEWETHTIKLKNDTITLSVEGERSVTLKHIGPPTPRPPGVKIPDDPDGH